MHHKNQQKQIKKKSKFEQSQAEINEDDIISYLKQSKQIEVIRVKQEDSSQVIKRINKIQVQNKPEQQEKIKEEMNACSSFKARPDDYVVLIHRVYESPMYYNLSMEWCASGTLQQEIENDAISTGRPQLCVLYLLSILYSMTACHERGINMHRDLKPQNILITHNLMQKKLKLADFGICTYQDVAKGFEGTDLYLAPEVWGYQHKEIEYEFVRNNGYFNNCDIWSLGVILFQLYNGLHNKYRCIQFPYVNDIYWQKGNKSQFMKKLGQYYQKVVQIEKGVEQNSLLFNKWTNLSEKNMRRMKCLQQLIRLMLQPHPLRRCSFMALYDKIKEKRQALFFGLTNTSVVANFQKYYAKEQKAQLNSLQSTHMDY